jgi:hypothetical protein
MRYQPRDDLLYRENESASVVSVGVPIDILDTTLAVNFERKTERERYIDRDKVK